MNKLFLGLCCNFFFQLKSGLEYSPDSLTEYATRAVIKKHEQSSHAVLNKLRLPEPLKDRVIIAIISLKKLLREHNNNYSAVAYQLLLSNTLKTHEKYVLDYIISYYPETLKSPMFKMRSAFFLAYQKHDNDRMLLKLFYSPVTDICAKFAGFSVLDHAVNSNDHEMVHRMLYDPRFQEKYSLKEVQEARNIASSLNFNKLYLTLDHFLLNKDLQ